MSDPDKTPPQTPSAMLRALTVPSEYSAALSKLQDDAASAIAELATNRESALLRIRRSITKAFILGRESAAVKP